MDLTQRQGKILNLLIREYIDLAEPISSELLSRLLKDNRGSLRYNRESSKDSGSIKSGKKKSDMNVSPATIRNDLQELTELGYVAQPHTSAGRVPTNKGYKYFVEIIFTENPSKGSGRATPDFISREIEQAKQKIEKELKLAQELTKSLTELSTTLSYTRLEDKDTVFEMLKIIGPSRTTYDKNIEAIKELLNSLENF